MNHNKLADALLVFACIIAHTLIFFNIQPLIGAGIILIALLFYGLYTHRGNKNNRSIKQSEVKTNLKIDLKIKSKLFIRFMIIHTLLLIVIELISYSLLIFTFSNIIGPAILVIVSTPFILGVVYCLQKLFIQSFKKMLINKFKNNVSEVLEYMQNKSGYIMISNNIGICIVLAFIFFIFLWPVINHACQQEGGFAIGGLILFILYPILLSITFAISQIYVTFNYKKIYSEMSPKEVTDFYGKIML